MLKAGQRPTSPASVRSMQTGEPPGTAEPSCPNHPPPPPRIVLPCPVACHDDGAIGSSTAKPQPHSSTQPPAELSLSELIRQKALSETSSDAIQVAQRVPCSSQELWPTPIFPPLLINHDILCGGQVLSIVSHMPWESMKFLYCIEWKPHDVDVAPIFWWVKLCGLVHHHALVNEYHHRHHLEPPKWPHKRKIKSSPGLGVREIRRALDERKVHLILTGMFIEEIAVQIANERWKMRDEWQRRGRGWGAAKEIVQRRRNEWLEAEYLNSRPEAGDRILTKHMDSLRLTKARILRQRSEPDIRLDRVLDEDLGKKFSVQDELEWREHFGGILLPGTQVPTPDQPRPKTASILQRDLKPPARVSPLRQGIIDSPAASLAPSECGSMASSQLASNTSDKGLLSILLQKLTWGRSGHSLSARECIVETSKLGFDGARTPDGQHGGLDGPPRPGDTAPTSDVSSPAMREVDMVSVPKFLPPTNAN
jgi:hypothetical protein